MKKVFTLCLFAFALLIGTQTAFAQDKVSINEIAANKTKELRSQLKFEDSALDDVYNAFRDHELKTLSIKENLKPGTRAYKDAIDLTDLKLQKSIKGAMSPELFARYLILTNQEEIIELKTKQ
ncbi:hypothetical protein [uncultured Lacinutrix sp.]|uniref:hypothetical protein n=1 Tax=uncultured Lacinutrix sp. TaxID=574032 RepID=UPI002609B156|nr:hypothetical protein [uncultured Lacinutrix sp.]